MHRSSFVMLCLLFTWEIKYLIFCLLRTANWVRFNIYLIDLERRCEHLQLIYCRFCSMCNWSFQTSYFLDFPFINLIFNWCRVLIEFLVRFTIIHSMNYEVHFRFGYLNPLAWNLQLHCLQNFSFSTCIQFLRNRKRNTRYFRRSSLLMMLQPVGKWEPNLYCPCTSHV